MDVSIQPSIADNQSTDSCIELDEPQRHISEVSERLFPELAATLTKKNQDLQHAVAYLKTEKAALEQGWTYICITLRGPVSGLLCIATPIITLGAGIPLYLRSRNPREYDFGEWIALCFVGLFLAGPLVASLGLLLPEILTCGRSIGLNQQLRKIDGRLKVLNQSDARLQSLAKQIDALSFKVNRLDKFISCWHLFERQPAEDLAAKLIKKIKKIPEVDCEDLFPEETLPPLFNDVTLFLMEDICRTLKQGTLFDAWNSLKIAPSIHNSVSSPKAGTWENLHLELPNPRFHHVSFAALSSFDSISLHKRLPANFNPLKMQALQKLESDLGSVDTQSEDLWP